MLRSIIYLSVLAIQARKKRSKPKQRYKNDEKKRSWVDSKLKRRLDMCFRLLVLCMCIHLLRIHVCLLEFENVYKCFMIVLWSCVFVMFGVVDMCEWFNGPRNVGQLESWLENVQIIKCVPTSYHPDSISSNSSRFPLTTANTIIKLSFPLTC